MRTVRTEAEQVKGGYPGRSGRHCRARPLRRRGAALVASIVLLASGTAAILGTGASSAAWTYRTSNAGNTFSAVSSYPGYQQSVLADNPRWLYSLNESQSSSSTSSANDTSSNGSDGTYGGATNGPSTWWKLDESSGTVADDASGAANPGSLGSSTSRTTGRAGTNAVSMTGTAGGYVTGRATLDSSRTYTVTAWAYPVASATRTVVSQSGTRASAFTLGLDGTSGKWRAVLTDADGSSPTTAIASSSANAALNTWTHLSAVYDSTAAQIKLYVNGTLNTTSSVPATWNATAAMQLGRRLVAGNWGEYWSGRIDDVRVYQHALSTTEISTLAAETGPVGAPITNKIPAATSDSSKTGTAFGGSANLYAPVMTAKAAFTSTMWLRVSGPTGGTVRAFASDATGTASTKVDRVCYFDNAGHLTFGALVGGVRTTIRSPLPYNDGDWHHLAMSSGTAGLKLYVDGELVASDPNSRSDDYSSGYTRAGGVSLVGWPNRPSNDYLVGTLDSVAYFETQLPDQNIAWYYHAPR